MFPHAKANGEPFREGDSLGPCVHIERAWRQSKNPDGYWYQASPKHWAVLCSDCAVLVQYFSINPADYVTLHKADPGQFKKALDATRRLN